MRCQSCHSTDFASVVSLGYLPPVNAFHRIGQPRKTLDFLPTDVFECRKCGLVQLAYIPSMEDVFPHDYPYRTGVTASLVKHFDDFARYYVSERHLKPTDLVVDIGGNDGTLCQSFRKINPAWRVVNVEPCREPAKDSENKGISTFVDVWDPLTAKRIRSKDDGRGAKLITACNVFAHTPDPNLFMEAVSELLDDDGEFVAEFQYWPKTVEVGAWDTIYHEHVRYWTLDAVNNLFHRHGFYMDDWRSIDTHAGSMRVIAYKAEQTHETGLDGEWKGTPPYFAARVSSSRKSIHDMVMKSVGRVVAIGAPSRGTTLIHAAGLASNGRISAVLENPASPKVGCWLPGTEIPVIAETEQELASADVALLLSWHLDGLEEKLRAKGFKGIFLRPMEKT